MGPRRAVPSQVGGRGSCFFAVMLSLTVATPSAAQHVTGFLQTDYLVSQQSEDQLDNSTGRPLNQTGFILRRGRLRLYDEVSYVGYDADVDLNTMNGFRVEPRQVEVSVHWPATEEASATPDEVTLGGGLVTGPADPPQGFRIRAGAGIFRTPFGYDVYESSPSERVFAEGTLLGQAYFPGDFDVGARVAAGYRNVSVTLAVMNGEPQGAGGAVGRDPNAAKDFFARFKVAARPLPWLRIDGALSAMRGTGFHAGTPATKDVLIWRDLNEDALVQLSELQVIRGSAGIASENFDRFGVGADLQAVAAAPWGPLTLFVEAATSLNLDRGIRPSDPVLTGQPQRGLAAYLAVVQEVRWGVLLGARIDYYQPSIDAAELQNGALVRTDERFMSYSFAAAKRIGAGKLRGRVAVDYTHRQDPLGRDAAGRPADLANDVLTLRAQVEF